MLHIKKVVVCISFFITCTAQLAQSQDHFLGEIRWVSFSFSPSGWALCDGQILPISQHTALFALLGDTYGGDGRQTFALPDMRGRVMVHAGQGDELSNYQRGEKGGQETVRLTTDEIPSHNHSLNASTDIADSSSPENRMLAGKERTKLYAEGIEETVMEATSIGETGGSGPHENRPPYTALTCIIAMTGIFPSQN